MDLQSDQYQIKHNFTAFALFLVVVLLMVDVVLRLKPQVLRPGAFAGGQISAVGHHNRLEDGTEYYIYTVFESNGDVYQCWWDGSRWNQKKVTNFKGPTLD